MMFLLYSLGVVAAAVALFRVSTVVRKAGVPHVLALCIWAGGLLYLSSVLPGLLSILTPAAVAVSLVLLSSLTVWLFSREARLSAPPTAEGTSPRDEPTLPGILIPAAPALLYVVARAHRPWDPSWLGLTWDTVSYHLPGFIEYFQSRSLYSLEGPFQTYSFGFELIGNFPSYFFQQHWGLFAAHVYAIVYLFAAIRVVTRNLLRAATGQYGGDWVAYCLAVSLVVWIFEWDFFFVGNNDIFQAACILAFFGMLLEMSWAFPAPQGDRRPVILTVLASVALALALATKPTALAYVPLIPLTWGLFYRARRSVDPDARWTRDLGMMVASLLAVVAVGGVFLIRNLVSTGAIIDERLTRMASSTVILGNLTNPALWQAGRQNLILGASMLTPFAIGWLAGLSHPRSRIVRNQAVLFSLAAAGAFALSPAGLILRSNNVLSLELRLGMPHFVMMAVAFGILATLALARVGPRLTSSLHARSPRWRMHPAVAMVLFVIAALLAPFYGTPPKGLPGFDVVRGLPRTTIYEWVQSLDQPTRIYSAGLRPYGLYGSGWRNRVFYDLHSSVLLDEAPGQARLAAVVTQFRPELILISVDPHDYTIVRDKPLLDWIRSQTACFQEVFEDPTVSGFRVKPGCEEHMSPYVPAGMHVRMRG